MLYHSILYYVISYHIMLYYVISYHIVPLSGQGRQTHPQPAVPAVRPSLCFPAPLESTPGLHNKIPA